jgi:tRNA G37 N-methylase TrmD
VPEELLSGHHARIEAWRRQQRQPDRATAPDLIAAARKPAA